MDNTSSSDVNPYTPSTYSVEPSPPTEPLGLGSRVLDGIRSGGLAAVVAGTVAFFGFLVALSLPFAEQLGFDAQFIWVWLVAGPMLASLGGLMGGVARELSSNAPLQIAKRRSRWASSFPGLVLIGATLSSFTELQSVLAGTGIILTSSLSAHSLASQFRFPRLVAEDAANDADADALCRRSLWLASVGFIVPSAFVVLAIVEALRVSWDFNLLPLGTMVLGILHFTLATSFAIRCRLNYRNWRASLAIVIAIATLPYWLLITWVLAMLGVATHPV